MKRFSIRPLKWFIQRVWSQVTIYHLIVAGLMIWLLGIWCWIIPIYSKKVSFLETENKKLLEIIDKHQPMVVKKISDNSFEHTHFNYAILLNMAEQHKLNLEEFRRLNITKESRYQIIVVGSWLRVREFLERFNQDFSTQLFIESFDFKRDSVTNELSLTMVMIEGKHHENP